MKKIKTIILFAVLLLLPLTAASSLELKSGRIKITLFEESGRLGIAYLKNVTGTAYQPLFMEQDPRTSYLSISMDNRIFTMGEAAGFKQSAEISSDNSVKYTWTSTSLTVEKIVSFISSPGSPLSDGVKIEIIITNNTSSPKNIAARYLFDTFLGEDKNNHFIINDTTAVNSESSFESGSMPQSLISASDKTLTNALQLMLTGQGITKPDKIVMANWKRLSDSPWDYSAVSGRNFNLLPYSINDSALALFYEPKALAAGEKRSIVIVMGNYSAQGFSLTETASSTLANVLQSVNTEAAGSAAVKTREQVHRDLLSVNDMINKINLKIKSGELLSEEELTLLENLLTELKRRKLLYDKEL